MRLGSSAMDVLQRGQKDLGPFADIHFLKQEVWKEWPQQRYVALRKIFFDKQILHDWSIYELFL